MAPPFHHSSISGVQILDGFVNFAPTNRFPIQCPFAVILGVGNFRMWPVAVYSIVILDTCFLSFESICMVWHHYVDFESQMTPSHHH